MAGKSPQIVEMKASRLEELLARAESQTLQPEDYQAIETLVQSYRSLIDLLQDKNTSLARLRKLLFGATSEKLSDLFPGAHPTGQAPNSSSDADPRDPPPSGEGAKDPTANDTSSSDSEEEKKRQKRARSKRRLQLQKFQASRRLPCKPASG